MLLVESLYLELEPVLRADPSFTKRRLPDNQQTPDQVGEQSSGTNPDTRRKPTQAKTRNEVLRRIARGDLWTAKNPQNSGPQEPGHQRSAKLADAR